MTNTNDAIWKSEEVARSFAAQSAQRERERGEQLTFVARLLPFSAGDTFTFADLGAGTGAAARAILTEYPNASAVLLEYSPQMAAEGKKLLTDFDGRYRYVEYDMLTSDWPTLPPLDAAISALSIHHLPDDRKQAIFREIHDRLRPGAWYVNYDPVKAGQQSLEDAWERTNDKYDPAAPAKRANRSPQEQARWENHVRYMIPLEPQLQWLRDAGFQDVDVFWKRLDWAIYGGRKR